MKTDVSPGISMLRDVCAGPYGIWLDSSMAGGTLGTRSFWAAEPVAVLRSWRRRVEVERQSATERFEGDPFETLRELLAEHARYREGAAVGYLGYGLKRHIERLPDTVTDDLGLPECHLAFYERLHEIEPGPLAPAEPSALGREFPEMRSTFSRAEYEASVRRALEYIRAGDIYQVNLSQRFEAACAEDPFEVYLRLRALSPALCCPRRRSGSCGTGRRTGASRHGRSRARGPGAARRKGMRRCGGSCWRARRTGRRT
jgi:para-aminobenzoate synthetase component 1